MLKQFPERQTNFYPGSRVTKESVTPRAQPPGRALGWVEGRLGPVVATDVTGRSEDCEMAKLALKANRGEKVVMHISMQGENLAGTSRFDMDPLSSASDNQSFGVLRASNVLGRAFILGFRIHCEHSLISSRRWLTCSGIQRS